MTHVWIASLAATCWPVAAQTEVQLELARITAPPPVAGDQTVFFGRTVAISSDWLVAADPVTHPGTFEEGFRGGYLYFYRRTPSGWAFHQQVFGTPNQNFIALSLQADTLIAGDYNWGDLFGRVHVFTLSDDKWRKTAEIKADGLSPGEYPSFGSSVDISGDVLVVGAPGVDEPIPFGGEVRIYERAAEEWAPAARFRLPLSAEVLNGDHDKLGISVAASGTTVIAGAGGNFGAVYVYERDPSGWSRTAIIENPSPATRDNFGWRVDVFDDLMLIGEPKHQNTFDPRPGRAFIYERDERGTWSLAREIRASDGYADSDAGDIFGGAVAIAGRTRVVVGAYRGRHNGPSTGTVYLFEKTDSGWPELETVRFVASDSSGQSDKLGGDLDVHDGFIVAGAEGAWHGGAREGKAYVFAIELGEPYCETANTARLGVSGSGELADSRVTLTVRGAPPNALGLFFVASGRGLHPFGRQALCLRPPLARFGPTVAGPDGIMLHEIHLDVDRTHWKLSPGSSWYFQLAHESRAGSGRLTQISNAVWVRLR